MRRPGVTIAVLFGVIVLVALVFVLVWQSRNAVPHPDTMEQNVVASASEAKSTVSEKQPVNPNEVAKQSDTLKAPPVPQPPKVTESPNTKAVVDALIARNDDASSKKLLAMHSTADEIARRQIERHAVEKDPKLKSAISEQAVTELDSTEPSRKTKALETLRFIADPSGVEKAGRLLSDNQKPEVVAGAISYLGRVNSNASFDKVIALAKESPDIGVKATAIRNLALTGGKAHPAETVAVMEEALSSPDVSIQAEALRGLGRFPENISLAGRKRISELASTEADDRKKEEVRDAAKMLLGLIENMKDRGPE
jgi:HEAT repeat protein